MRKLSTALMAIVILAIFGFAGSWISSILTGPATEPETPALPTAVENLVGVIDGISADGHEVTLRTHDGSTETVRTVETVAAAKASAGKLARVSGTRDAATRRIEATSFEIWNDAPNLVVTSPEAGATVNSPLVVFGFGRVFENRFRFAIQDASGETVTAGFATTDAEDAGEYGTFRFEVFLPALTDQNFTLQVFVASARDGRPVDLVAVPLKLLTIETVSFNVFFGNRLQGSNQDCEKVFPVTRTIAKTSAVGRAALLELILGPTSAERAAGAFTSLPGNVFLNSLSINDGVAVADFDAGLRNVAGSCRVIAIRSQIEETLTQFDSVEDVEISVEGDFETALQP